MRYSVHVLGGPRADPGLAEEIISLVWFGNDLELEEVAGVREI